MTRWHRVTVAIDNLIHCEFGVQMKSIVVFTFCRKNYTLCHPEEVKDLALKRFLNHFAL